MKDMPEHFVVCIHNEGYAASLEPRKIYRVVADPRAQEHGLSRVIDESGEDYLFPAELFIAIELPQHLQQALALAS
ncbi:MAG: hypothetical protein V1772_01825 [Chloroflexota bacterium]